MDNIKTIFIASDHRGFDLKYQIVKNWSNILSFAPELGNIKIIDLTTRKNPEDDYNDAALAVVKNLKKTKNSAGILLCGTAIGVSIAANRFKGVRAAICYNDEIARLSREHEDANVICFPADYTSLKSAAFSILEFLTTKPLGAEKYLRRTKRLDTEGDKKC